MTKFYFIRHGHMDSSMAGQKFYKGFSYNMMTLSEKGISQIYEASKNEILKDAELIITSPFGRTMHSAAIISKELNLEIAEKAKDIYELLNCKGLVRIDFIHHTEKSELYFLEVNTVPGQTSASLVPQQVEAAGISLSTFYKDLVIEALK